MRKSRSGYDDVTEDFLILIGRIVIGWSRIERAIDLALVQRRSLIPKHFEKGPPISLDPKMRAFRALCKQIPAFEKMQPWIEGRITELLELAQQRHTIIHGFFHGVSGEPEPQIYFRRATPLSGDAGHRLIATRAELEVFLERLRKLDFDFIGLMLTAIGRRGSKTTSPPAPTA